MILFSDLKLCRAWSSELHVAASDKQGWSVAAMHCIQASKIIPNINNDF